MPFSFSDSLFLYMFCVVKYMLCVPLHCGVCMLFSYAFFCELPKQHPVKLIISISLERNMKPECSLNQSTQPTETG